MPTPTNPPVPSGTDPLVIYTFEWWTVKANDTTGTVPEDNLTNLNLAIAWSAANGIPIYGLKGNYRIRPTGGSPCVNLLAGARIFCAPGCVISWDVAPSSVAAGTPGLVYSSTGSSGAHWIGGEWTPVLRGVFPLGDVFNLAGDDMLFERVTVTDHRAGRAFAISGNRNSIVKPTIISTKLNADGVRVIEGTVFRCLDGIIDVTGDAVLISPTGAGTNAIGDCAVLGTKLASSGGSLVAIETAYGPITDVRIGGVEGTVGSSANAVRIRNLARSGSGVSAPIGDIAIRDFRIHCGTSTDDLISISNTLADLGNAVTSIALTNVDVVNDPAISGPARTTLRVASTATDVTFLSWCGGGVRGGNYSATCMSLQRLTGGVFDGLSFDAGSGTVIAIGSGAACTNVAVSDTSVLGVKVGQKGVLFDQAISSGFVRGAMTGAQNDTTPASNAIAATFTSSARGCYIEEANLAGIGSDVGTSKIEVSAAVDYRLTSNYGSAQQTTTVGAQVEVTIASTATTIAPKASFVKVKIT